MDLGVRIGDVLAFFFPTLFAAWPLIMAAPIAWRRPSLTSFLAMWGLLAIIRVIVAFIPTKGLAIIPEPASTLLFLALGTALGLFYIIRRAASQGVPRR
jgi:hypothetical protein